jgi:hypothetical protein
MIATRPWIAARKAEGDAILLRGHQVMAQMVLARDLDPATRAEAERLAALPPGAEDRGLRRLALGEYRPAELVAS